jgi:glycosyltransferase involved in cell wall biosynthesis
MSAPPRIAVVTPVYNGADFLSETMACVQAQTYPNLVHVVLDNASGDASPDIIVSFKGQRVPVVSARNSETIPLQDNWNAAMALAPAEAKYIRILCADDVMAPEAVSKMAALAQQHPDVGLVGCGHHRDGPTEADAWPRDQEVFAGREALAQILLGERMLIATHTLMRRSALDWSKPLFRRGLVASDTQTCLDMLTRSDFGFVHDDLAKTRMHDASMTSALVTGTEIHFFDWLMLLKQFGPHAFDEAGFPAVLRRYRRHYARRMLRWRLAGRRETLAKHDSALSGAGETASLWRDADALLDWAACKLKLRTQWSGYPF